MNNWYVITGPPSSGITTTVELLAKQGYKVIPDAAREYLNEELAQGRTIEELRQDERQLQNIVLMRRVAQEATLDPQELIFLDRGIPDVEAYNALYGWSLTPEQQAQVNGASYKHVFLAELGLYQNDYARIESEELARQLETLLETTYANHHLPTTKLPWLPVEERVERILAVVNHT